MMLLLIGFINDEMSLTESAHAERVQRCRCSQILPIMIYLTLDETSFLLRSFQQSSVSVVSESSTSDCCDAWTLESITDIIVFRAQNVVFADYCLSTTYKLYVTLLRM